MMKRFLNQRGDVNAVGILFTVLILIVFIFAVIDIWGFMSTKNKLTQAAQETLEIMKAEGGFDNESREFFYEYCRNRGLDISRITVQGTPKLVQRGGKVEVITSTFYVLKAFQPLGLGEIEWKVDVKVDGLGRTYFREI